MAYWVDVDGSLKEADEDTAQRYGLRPATDEDLLAHNERLADEAADTKGALGNIAEGVQRGMAHVQDIARDVGWTPPVPGGDAFGMGGTIPAPPGSEAAAGTPLPPPGAESFPEATSDDARRRSRLHPIQQGIGTGLVAAPASALAGAAVGALGGPTILGAAAGGILAEQAVEAIAQEYDDAWLEQRPMQLSNVAAYTAMFGLGDVLLRGAGHVAKTAIGDIGKSLGIFGDSLGSGGAQPGRNIVAEAQARAERGGVRQTQSVGAASAKEMNEPFDDALATMSDRDATVLARDAPDFEPLVAMHSADDITRLNTGLSESLGNQLKKRDVQIASDALKPAQIQAQQGFASEIIGQALDVAQHLRTGGPSRMKFGNHGKAIAGAIEDYAGRLQDAAAPADRFNLLNSLKQELDKRIMAVGRDFGTDAAARSEVLKILGPLMGENLGKGRVTKGALREGLENVSYFGEAARLQKALNAPWHDLLQHWSKFQQSLLEDTGSTEWGTIGAGRVGRESTDERVMSMIGKDPRMLRQMGAHVGGVYDAYQRLIEARQAHGYVEKEGLDSLSDSIRNLMEDWNLASTIGVAKNKAKNKLRDPRKWAGAALDLAEKAPFGVGSAVGIARGAGRMFGDLHIQKGTPLAGVWDDALKRYAAHPALEDASIYANYSPWMQDALRARGARIPGGPSGGAAPAARAAAGGVEPPEPPPSGGAAGSPGFGWGKAAEKHGGKVAGVGLLGASAAAEDDDNPNGAAAAGVAGLSLLLGRRALRLGETLAPMPKGLERKVKMAVFDAELEIREAARLGKKSPAKFYAAKLEGASPEAAEYLRTVGELADNNQARIKALPEGKADDWTNRTNKDAVWQLHKAKREAHEALTPEERYALSEYVGNAYQRVRLVESGVPDDELVREFGIPKGNVEEAKSLVPALQSAGEKLTIKNPTEHGTLYRGMSVNDSALAELLGKDEFVTHSTTSTSWDPGVALSFAKRDGHDVILRIKKLDAGALAMNTGEEELLIPRGAKFKVTDRSVWPPTMGLTSDPTVVIDIEQIGRGDPKALSDAGVLAAMIGIGGAATAATTSRNAAAAEQNPRMRPQGAPPPADPGDGPVGLYRNAVRDIAEGGDAIIRDKASSMLRARAPKGRGALRAFTGRRSLDDAVDQAREALEALGRDPAALVDRLAGSVGDLGRTHPSVYMALVGKASSLVSYLAAEAPQRTGQTLLDPEGSPPSLDRSLDFAYKAVGTLMPVRAMDDVVRLDAPPEEVAAFQQNWPELWEPLRAELIGQLQRRTEAGRPVDAEKLRQLDAILGMNGQLDPSGSLDVAQQLLAAQEQFAAAPPAQGGQAPSAGANGAASSFRTRLDAVQLETQTT